MKRSISLLSALAFVLVFSGSVFGQDNITASANILSNIDYTVQSDISFGNLQSNFTSATIDPAATSGDAGVSNATAARITVNGSGSNTVLVTDPGTQTLTQTGSSDQLSLSTTVTGVTGDVTNARGGSALANGNELSLTSGVGTLWIGGTLTPVDDGDGSIDTGTYETTFQLTLDYL